jgi:hypothetical protein
MDLNDYVIYPCLWLRPLGELHAGLPGRLVRHNDCLHAIYLLGFSPKRSSGRKPFDASYQTPGELSKAKDNQHRAVILAFTKC